MTHLRSKKFNTASDVNFFANNGSHKTSFTPKVTAVGTVEPNRVRRWWSSFLLLGIVFSLIFSACIDEEEALVNKSKDLPNKHGFLYNSYQLGDFSVLDTDTKVEVNDYLFEQIGQAHNYYLENIIKDFDFNASNYEQELQNRILNVNISIDKFPISFRDKFVDNLSTNIRRVKNGNKLLAGDTCLMSITLEDIIETINVTNLSDKNILTEYITKIVVYMTSEDNIDEYSVLCSKLDTYKRDIINNPQASDTSVIVVKAFVELLEASAEFWYPIEFGGNGAGAKFLDSIWYTQISNDKPEINKFQVNEKKPLNLSAGQSAAVADGLAVAGGWVGVAIGAAFTPITAGFSLIGAMVAMAVETAIASGTAALMSSGGGNSGNPGRGGKGGGNGNSGNNGGSGGKGGGKK